MFTQAYENERINEWICNFRDQCHGSGGFDIEFRDWKCHWKCDYNRIIFTKMFEKHSFKY